MAIDGGFVVGVRSALSPWLPVFRHGRRDQTDAFGATATPPPLEAGGVETAGFLISQVVPFFGGCTSHSQLQTLPRYSILFYRKQTNSLCVFLLYFLVCEFC